MRRLLAAVVGCLLVLTGCGGAPPADLNRPMTKASVNATATQSAVGPYVALGDSYTAAPYVYLTDVANGCLRSDGNYPALLAKQLGATRFVDVSCSGATTGDIAGPQKTFSTTLPAQLDAVSSGTRLVTVGIGGNDFNLFRSLSGGCPLVGPDGIRPPKRPTGVCGQVDVSAARKNLDAIGRLVTRSLRAVHRKAPHAVVVLVGYPRITSPGRSCTELLPVSPSNAARIDALTRRLSTVMRASAKASRSLFVDMYAASKGHDVCAGKRAWVNGVRTDTARAASLHPFAIEQRAAARLIGEEVAAALSHR